MKGQGPARGNCTALNNATKMGKSTGAAQRLLNIAQYARSSMASYLPFLVAHQVGNRHAVIAFAKCTRAVFADQRMSIQGGAHGISHRPGPFAMNNSHPRKILE